MRLKDMITPEMKLGQPEFENTVFILKTPPTKANIDRFVSQGKLLPEPIDEVAWALPAYLTKDYNLFFVFAPNLGERWTISCSQVTIEDKNRITAMSAPVPVGTGLNAINQVDPAGAIELVAYLKTLEANGLGYFDETIWRRFV